MAFSFYRYLKLLIHNWIISYLIIQFKKEYTYMSVIQAVLIVIMPTSI